MDNSENKKKNKQNYFVDFLGGTIGAAVWSCFLWIVLCAQLSYCTYKEVLRFINYSEIKEAISDIRDTKLREVKVVGISTDEYYDVVKGGVYKAITEKHVIIHDIELDRDFKLPPNQLDVTNANKGKIIKMNISKISLVGGDNVEWPFAARGWEILIALALGAFYLFGICFVAPEDFENKMYKKYGNKDWKPICDIYEGVFIFPIFWCLAVILFGTVHMMCFW